jgi:hypothetical protein
MEVSHDPNPPHRLPDEDQPQTGRNLARLVLPLQECHDRPDVSPPALVLDLEMSLRQRHSPGVDDHGLGRDGGGGDIMTTEQRETVEFLATDRTELTDEASDAIAAALEELDALAEELRLVWQHMHGVNIDGTRRALGDDGACCKNWIALQERLDARFKDAPTPTRVSVPVPACFGHYDANQACCECDCIAMGPCDKETIKRRSNEAEKLV